MNEGFNLDNIFLNDEPRDKEEGKGLEHYFVDFYEKSELPDKGQHFRLMVKKHALWGDHLWNGGQWLARYLFDNPQMVKGKRVIELGAGAGLPSLVAWKLGAEWVTCTDYPDFELIENLEENFKINCSQNFKENCAIKVNFFSLSFVVDLF
jgi:predicted nicotinamide N-methyase